MRLLSALFGQTPKRTWRYPFTAEDFCCVAEGMRPVVDFEWFAKDADGRIAVFTTAGSGYVPACSVSDRESHRAIACALFEGHEQLDWFPMVGAAGCYGFDFDGDFSSGAYKREVVPIKPAISRESERLLLANSHMIPAFPFRFADCDVIRADQIPYPLV